MVQAVTDMTTRTVTHVPAGSGDRVGLIGEQFTFKVTQADTNGALSIIEMLAYPGGGPPLHTHPSAEAFVILDGEFEFSGLEDGEPFTLRATAGDTVFIAAGDPHTYQAIGDTPSRTMLIFTPGLEMEAFFREAGFPMVGDSPAEPPPPDIPGMIAIAEKHGLTFLPPSAP